MDKIIEFDSLPGVGRRRVCGGGNLAFLALKIMWRMEWGAGGRDWIIDLDINHTFSTEKQETIFSVLEQAKISKIEFIQH